MKYNLREILEVTRAFDYLAELVETDSIVDIKKVSPIRTLNQNSYLHLLLGAFGGHFGYTIEEAKLIYKEINRDIYYYDKKGRTFIRSSADLNKEEMAKTIDAFRTKSDEAGYPLPLATDQDWLLQIENAIEQQRRYL